VQGLDGFSTVAVDFSCVHALHPSTNLANVYPGNHAKSVEQMKNRRYLSSCRRAGWHFVPFVVEVVGGCGGKGNWLMQRIIALWSAKYGWTISEAATHCRGRVAAALMQGVCRQLERAFPEVAGSGYVDTSTLL
jgi:hypothetical protein